MNTETLIDMEIRAHADHHARQKERHEALREADEHVGAQRVLGLRTVHREGDDVAVALHGAVLRAHGEDLGHGDPFGRFAGSVGMREPILPGVLGALPSAHPSGVGRARGSTGAGQRRHVHRTVVVHGEGIVAVECRIQVGDHAHAPATTVVEGLERRKGGFLVAGAERARTVRLGLDLGRPGSEIGRSLGAIGEAP